MFRFFLALIFLTLAVPAVGLEVTLKPIGAGGTWKSDQGDTLEFVGGWTLSAEHKKFGSTNLDLMAGYSWQHLFSESSFSETTSFDGSNVISPAGKDAGELYLLSLFSTFSMLLICSVYIYCVSAIVW